MTGGTENCIIRKVMQGCNSLRDRDRARMHSCLRNPQIACNADHISLAELQGKVVPV